MKELIRKKYLKIRKNIQNKEEKEQIIFNKVINNEKTINSSLILIYVSTKEEVDTIKLIKYFLKTKQVAVPKVEGNNINFYYIKSLRELKKGNYNILEPITNNKVNNIDNAISITPGICYSKDLYRIGYGKGYYDRFYQNNNIYKIGLCFKSCLLDKLPHDKYDIKVDEIITE